MEISSFNRSCEYFIATLSLIRSITLNLILLGLAVVFHSPSAAAQESETDSWVLVENVVGLENQSNVFYNVSDCQDGASILLKMENLQPVALNLVFTLQILDDDGDFEEFQSQCVLQLGEIAMGACDSNDSKLRFFLKNVYQNPKISFQLNKSLH